ncbi:MAG: acyl carrier protein, partial [Verrucomicrobiota bacterium]
METLSGLKPEEIDESASFLDLGLDSLFLTQAATAISKSFGIRVTFRQLIEDLPTPGALTDYIEAELPPDAEPAEEPETEARPDQAVEASSGVEQLILQQLDIMDRQLSMLEGKPSASGDRKQARAEP